MGVYIKDIEMPTSCDNCWALDDDGDYPRCRITGELRGYNFQIKERRMDKCPLVPVSPHGDLIDKKALLKKGMRLSWSVQLWVQEADIVCAPTIIPAEEENK